MSSTHHTSNQRPVSFPEFDELMYLYHRNIQEYQYTIQEMTERIETNSRRNSRQQHTILDNLVYPYHRNMQEYNQVTLRCLDVLQNIHTLHHTNPRNPSTPLHSHIPVPAPAPVTQTNTSTTLPTSNRPPAHTTRPVEFEFTLFPGMPGTIHLPNIVPRNPNTSTTMTLLTAEQIARTTREYVFQESDRSSFPSAPVCPIMLEEFQVGNHVRQIIHCGHHFLSSSLNRWFRRSSCCPVCRYNLWDVSAQEPQLFTGRTSDSRANSIVDTRLSDTHNIVPRVSPEMSMVNGSTMFSVSPTQNTTVLQTPYLATTGSSSSLINSYFSGNYPLDRSATTEQDVSNNNMMDMAEEEDTPFLDFQSSNMEGAETSIRNWISSFIQNNQPGMFPNMDLDISYTVEYDYPVDASGQVN